MWKYVFLPFSETETVFTRVSYILRLNCLEMGEKTFMSQKTKYKATTRSNAERENWKRGETALWEQKHLQGSVHVIG